MRLFFIAMQFLTIFPLPFAKDWQPGEMGRSMRWFPLVGLVIGALLAAADYGLRCIFPGEIVALLLVALMALVTGALHLDGLADVFDGFGARGGRERFLAVMKDSGTGAIGATALFLGLMLKYEALLHLPDGVRSAGIVFFPAVARFSQVVMTVGSRKARDDGLGAGFVAGAGWTEQAVAVLTVLIAAFSLLGFTGIITVLVVTIFTWSVKRYFHYRLGGVTGDVIGCVSELAEILTLLTVIAVAGRI